MRPHWGLRKYEVKVHYQILILVRWWEAGRIVGCHEICLWRRINLSPLRRLRSKKSGWLFLRFKHLTSSISRLHLSLSGPSSLCQSQHSKRNKTAYHDDKGDGSYKTPYEMIVHTQPAPMAKKGTLQLNGRTHNKNNISSSCSCATIINGNKFIFGYLGWWLCVICSQYLGSGWILIQLFKTEGRPQVAPLDSWVLAEIWPLIYVKGFFYTALFSLREHLQTRGHRRVFKQKGFNVAAAPPETTVSSPSATFKWHKKLNSCPPGAQMFFGVVSRETNKAPAEMAAAYRHSGWVHTV